MSSENTSSVKLQITRVTDNLSNIAKELEQRGTSLSQDGLKLVSAQLRAACAQLAEVHTPAPITEDDLPKGDGVASSNWASNTAANPSASEAPGTVGTPRASAQSDSPAHSASKSAHPASSGGTRSTADLKNQK